jgi:hypothetical protein
MIFFWLRLDGSLWLTVTVSHIATGICITLMKVEE